jgi:hypothetical protein
MSKRSKATSKKEAAGNGSASSEVVAASTSLMPAKLEDRIYVDNSNASELKLTCDEAVERVSNIDGGVIGM